MVHGGGLRGDRAGYGLTRAAGRDDASDAELLSQHVGGDPDAFGTLFLRHRDRLWAVALRTLSDPEEAADALQDAMLSAFRRAGGFRGDAAVTTWLHRIVVNACLDRMRRRSARPAFSGGDERALSGLAGAAAQHDPSSDTDLSIDVCAALRDLPHDQRLALVYVDMLGYPVAEAAKILGVSEGTIKSRCARGRAKLLPRLAHLRQAGRPAIPRPATPRTAGDGGSPAPARNRSAGNAVLPAGDGGGETL